MSYPTPMDVAEGEDRDADLSPSERLANICAALAEDLDNSPFTREEWVKLDADRLELIAANYAFASENERLRGLADPIRVAALTSDWHTFDELIAQLRGAAGQPAAVHDDARDAARWRYGAKHGFPRLSPIVTTHSAAQPSWLATVGYVAIQFSSAEEAMDAVRAADKPGDAT